MEEHFLYLSSDDCREYFPNNTGGHFIAQLPRTLYLQGPWKCALLEFRYAAQFKNAQHPDDLIICSDICVENYINNVELPVLRRITVDYDKPKQKKCVIVSQGYYVPIVPNTLKHVKIYIKGSNETNLSFSYKVTCVLHLKRVA